MGLALAAMLCADSCQKNVQPGTLIRFHASAHRQADTKTVYGNIDGSSQDYQALNWVEGDLVCIYCPQASLKDAPDTHVENYRVVSVTADGTSSVAGIMSDSGSGLLWGTANPHYFYGIYPADTITPGSGSGMSVSGTIPAAQFLTWSGTVGAPDMSLAYMYASATSAPEESVEMGFVPEFTAFQFEISPDSRGTAIDLTAFELSTSDTAHPLAGTFTLSGVAGSESIAFTGTATSISVPLDVTLPVGETLVLTVFVLPQDVNSLTISFTGNQIGTRSLALSRNKEPLTFLACRKYRVYGLTFPYINGIIAQGEDIDWNGSIDVTSGGETITWGGQSSIVGEGTDAENVLWGGMASITGNGGNAENVSWNGMTSQGNNVGENVNWE